MTATELEPETLILLLTSAALALLPRPPFAGLLLGLSAITDERWEIPQQPEVRWSLVYLVVLGSAGLFAIVLLVVRRWTASATSYMFVLFPLVTMALGALLLDERVTAHGVVGAVVVMGGAWLGALSPESRRPAPVRNLEPARPALDSG